MILQQCLKLVALALTIAVLASAQPAERNSQLFARDLPGPDEDPFYNPDDGWKDEEPGTILRTREIQPVEFSYLKLGVKGYQLLYRTNGIDPDSPLTTVTTVLIPDNHDKDKLVTANVYEDAFSSKCAPSYTLREGADLFKNVVISYQELFFTTLLHEGWVVTVPDHQGPTNAFTSGRLEGHTVLDAIRATLKFDKIGLSRNADVIAYGYSGGALATGWAAGLQPVYAPELNIAGWSMGGTVTNVRSWVQYIDNTNGAGFAVASLAGLVFSYPELNFVKHALTTRGKRAFKYASEHCLYETLWHFEGQQIYSDSFFEGGSSFFSNSTVNDVYDKLIMGRYDKFTPRAPVYMFHAEHDEVVPYNMGRRTAESWCDNGAKIHFRTISGLEMAHQSTELANMPNVVTFMRERFSHKPWSRQCRFDSVGNPWWNPVVLGKSLANILQQVLDLFGGRIGDYDHIIKDKLRNKEKP